MAVGEKGATQQGELPIEEEGLQKGRQWIEGLRAASETEGVLVGDPNEMLQSPYFPVEDDMELRPGFAFWRTREDVSGQIPTSRLHLTANHMQVGSYKLWKDRRGTTWVHFRSRIENSRFEEAQVRLERLEGREHDIAIK